MKLPYLTKFLGQTAEERWQNDDCFAKWNHGEMSNLEYLLRINRLAGRRYELINESFN